MTGPTLPFLEVYLRPPYGNHPGSVYGARSNEGAKANDYADEDGMETVKSWTCAPGCPVAALDTQSGTLKSGCLPSNQYTVGGRDNSSMFAGSGVFTHRGYEADSGGASRFFKQVGGRGPGTR